MFVLRVIAHAIFKEVVKVAGTIVHILQGRYTIFTHYYKR